MKIFGHNYQFDNFKFLLTKRIFKILQTIEKENKNLLILSPCTKYNQIFNFKKDNCLTSIIAKNDYDYCEKIINENFLENLTNQINKFFNIEILNYNLEYEKIIKTVFNISDQYICEKELPKILNILDQFVLSKTQVIVVGFNFLNPQQYENLEILYIVDNIKQTFLKYHNLEILLIDNIKNNQLFVVEDNYKLLKWIELQSKTVITQQQFNDYLNGKINYTSFLIDNCLQKISEIEL